ncbi:putative ribonuclease H-like domain-containing protein [Tanacetum coccineum]
MDLFGPVSVESVNSKKYCLVVTDDCSKFSWVFFLAYKDETYDMLHDLIPASTPIEAHKSLGKDEEGEDVDVHTYRTVTMPLTIMIEDQLQVDVSILEED